MGAPLDDFAWNVALYVPLGYSYGNAGGIAVVSAGAVSLLIETAQGFFRGRFSQPADVVSNTVGAALGVALLRFLVRWVA